MRIALDASPLDQPWATGVEKAFLGLLRGLADRNDDDEYLLVAPRRPRLLPEWKDPRFQLFLLGGRGRNLLWRERLVPSFAHRERIDVWHSPVQALPMLLDRPKVATMHELSWFETKGVEDEGSLRKRKAYSMVVARTADRVLCVSDRTRMHFLRLHPEAEERCRVIHHGVAPAFFNAQIDRARLTQRYGIDAQHPYFLTVGRALKRKGLPHALRAFRVFLDKTGGEHRLVLAGPRNRQMEDALALGKRLGLQSRLLPTGYVAEEDLPALYASSAAFLFPSESEGFGLPLLEAMAAGTPVVANAAASIPEVSGTAALLVDFERPLVAAEAMISALQHRDAWLHKGRERAAQFPLAGQAQAVRDLWKEIAA